jgi:hypothetical protein
VAPHLFSRVNVGEVHLDLWHRYSLQGVMDGVGVVGPGSGVDDQALGVCGFVDPGYQLSLVVGLAELELDPWELAAQEFLHVLQRLLAVDLRAALT